MRRRRPARTGTYAAAFATRPFRWALIAYGLASAAQGMWSVALAVALFEQTGDAVWTAVAASSRLLPYVLLSPLAGALADRWGHRRTLEVTGAVRIALAALLTAGIAMSASPALLALVAFAATTAATPVYPTLNAFVPTAVANDDLAAANSLLSTTETLSWIVGPALGGLLLAVGSTTATATTATALLVVALAALRLVPRGAEPAASGAGPDEGLASAVSGGLRAIRQTGAALAVLLVLLGTNLIDGSSQVLLLLVSDRKLGLGDGGYGLLNATLGAGALGAVLVNRRMAAGPRPLRPLLVAVGVGGAAYAALAFVSAPAGAVGLVLVLGGASVVAEVVAVTVVQHAVPRTHLARVFGIVDALTVGAILAGAAVAPLLEAALGLEGALVVLGVAGPLLALALAPSLWRAAAVAATTASTLRPVVECLARLDLLRYAPEPVLDSLALAATTVAVPPGQVVVQEGAPPDDVYVVLAGSFAVLRRQPDGSNAEIDRCQDGDCFGEVGPLTGQARNASVVALGAARLLRIPGEAFVAAVSGNALGSGGSATAGIVGRVANPVEVPDHDGRDG